MGTFKDHTGERFGRWTVESRAPNLGTTAAWNCLCDCGSRSVVRGTDLRNGSSTNCGCRRKESVGEMNRGATGAGHPAWKGADVEYVAAHQRVRALRGPASGHACADCGAAAKEWSYVGGSAQEKTSLRDKPGAKYSTDPWAYVPRCNACHVRHDRALGA